MTCVAARLPPSFSPPNHVPIMINESATNELPQSRAGQSDRKGSATVPRHWLRFHTRHLLGLMAGVAISVVALDIGAKTIGTTSTTVEIIRHHRNWGPSGSIEFLVQHTNGFSQSAVSVPEGDPTIDYSKLVGTRIPLQYRAKRILWLPPENPTIAAYHLVQAKVDQFGNDVRSR